jgi:hypothetical protein
MEKQHMSIYRKDTVIASYPAYDVVQREKESNKDYINLVAGERVVLPNHRGNYMISSAVSYALESGSDPIHAYNRAKGFGHETHWINHLGSCISDHPTKQAQRVEVNIGDFVRFEGLLFEIVSQPNDNLGLKEIV